MSGRSGKKRCEVCLRGCSLDKGEVGFCGVWGNDKGEIRPVRTFTAIAQAVDPIEKKPVYHFRPGTHVFSVGGWGCSFHCVHCRNEVVACVRESPSQCLVPPSAGIVPKLRETGCDGMAWTFTEATLWFETVGRYAERCARDDLFTIVLTHGAATRQVYRRLLSSGVRVWKVDLKGFSERAYRRVARLENWTRLLDNIRWLKQNGDHLELSFCPIPGVCDGEDEVRAMGQWVAKELGRDTPIHLLAFFPARRMRHIPFGDAAKLSRLRRLLLYEIGLCHVYVPLSFHSSEVTTYCSKCGATLVERRRLGPPRLYLDDEGRCRICEAHTPIIQTHGHRSAKTSCVV